jgi:hypothetical protein
MSRRVAAMTMLAVAPGTVAWSALAAGATAWLAILALSPRALLGPRRLVRWALTSWLSRFGCLAAWWIVGWHLFCQRP